MSSTEEYLDSLLRSVMSGKKPPEPINEILNETPEEPVVSEPTVVQPTDDVIDVDPSAIEQPVVDMIAEAKEQSAFSNPLEGPSFDEITPDFDAPRGDHVSFIGSIIGEIPNDVAPMVEEAPIYDEMPQIEEEAPIYDEMPQIEEEAPIYDEMPQIEEEAPIYDEMPQIEEEAPIYDEMPQIEEEAPIYDEMPQMEEEAPIYDEMPQIEEEAPIYDEMPQIEEEAPIYDEMPQMEEEAPIYDEMPQMEEEQPVYEEPQTDEPIADEDISNLLKSIEEMSSPTEESISEPEVEVEDEAISESEADFDSNLDLDSQSDLQFDEETEIPSEDRLGEDASLDDLLSSMGDDSELSEIGDLLSMSDNNEIVDESVLAQTEDDGFDASSEDFFNIDEPIGDDVFADDEEEPSKKNKKKKEKKKKEKKKKYSEAEATEDAITEDGIGGEPSESKKQGFFGKLMDVLTKEVEEDEESSETKQVFEETALDIAVETAAENEKILDEMGDEEEPEDKKGKKGKAKKEKKPKEKKQKPQKEIFPDDDSYKKLPLKKVIVICLLCFSLGIMITLLTYLYPYYRDTKKAQAAYDHGDYTETYTDLKGHNLNKKQQELYNKSVVILKVKRKLDSFDKYMKLNMPAQALDALLQGLRNSLDFASAAEELGVGVQFNQFRSELEEKVVSTFDLNVETAYEWCMIDDAQEYSRKIYDYLDRKGMNNSSNVSTVDNSVISGEEEEFAE